MAVTFLLVTLVGYLWLLSCRFHRLYLKILLLFYIFYYQERRGWNQLQHEIAYLNFLFVKTVPLKISQIAQFEL